MRQIYIISVVFLSILSTSCYKQDPTTATVEVLRMKDSTAVGNVGVRLYYDGSERIDEVLTTSSAGQVSIDLSNDFKPGQSGFMVLDIDLKYDDGSGEAKVGVIKIEEEKDNFQTVFCREC